MKPSVARKQLEKRYEKGCFIERAGIRKISPKEEEELRKIYGFKKFDRKISYHHIKEKHLGGRVTIENGANLAVYNHIWLHSQPPEVKEEINKKLQEFKFSIDMARLSIGDKNMDFDKLGILNSDMSDVMVIEAHDITEDEMKKRRKFNRAKEKRITQKMIEEELDR